MLNILKRLQNWIKARACEHDYEVVCRSRAIKGLHYRKCSKCGDGNFEYGDCPKCAPMPVPEFERWSDSRLLDAANEALSKIG